jgi:flagellar biosynthetic protein FlhB
MSGGGEKTEKPTPQKKKKARQEGTVARSNDVGAWLGMLAASFLVPMTLGAATDKAISLMDRIPAVIDDPDPAEALGILGDGMLGAALAVAPLAGAMMVLGIVAAAAQGGIHVATKLMVPKFSRLNPFKGFKKMFGPQGLWEGAKALIKTVVLGGVLYASVQDLIPVLMTAGRLPLGVLIDTVVSEAVTLIRFAAAAGLVMAGADYLVVRRRVNKQLRMTKHEVKEEYKRTEGDPHVKGQIRQRQLEMARSRMMADVPKADVVLVNPTHVAVALRYEPAKGAPRVLAKGAGAVAAKIRTVATENRIPLVQDVALARALHKSCDIGQEIPAEFFGAVAKVLAFVMQLKRRGSAAGLHRPFPTTLAPEPTPRHGGHAA